MFNFYEMMSPSLSSSRLPTSNGITKVSATTNGNSKNGTVHSRLQASRSSSSNGGGGGGATTEADQMQRRKCENLISYFTNQIQNLNKELEIEKHSRDTHLAKIAKALLCFEAKLKNDQKQIRQQLYEKDTQLNRLASEVLSLREKYGVKDDETQQIDPVAQYCPNCRKQYYSLGTADVSVQVNKHGPICRDDIDKENNMRPNSSSEDGLGQVFSSEARRSKRYMSKRTSGTFREYLNSRNIDLAFNCSDESSFNKSFESSQPQSEQMEHKPIVETKTKDGFMRKGSMRRSTKSSVAIKCDKNGNKLSDKTDNETAIIKAKSAATDSNGRRAFDIEVSANNQTTKSVSGANNSFLKKYDNDVSKPKNPQFESNDDVWYASASDMDDSDGAVSKPYGYNAVNPVLECVNQILLQQSMDGIMESCANRNDTSTDMPAATSTPSNNNNLTDSPPKETTNTLKKRVHFSTQNSMVQVPRSDSSSNLYRLNASATSTVDACNAKDLSYATIYGNEYEPIGSENNSTNHYVDMDSKLEDERCPSMIEKPKTPPALPPKPPNLLKFRQILKMSSSYPVVVQSTSTKSVDNESEPDYCSIGDVQETVKSVQIVADVHKNADDDVSSHASEETKTDMTDETFADIPKLPNVVALLSPKKESSHSKVIAQDNYVIKSSPPKRAKPAVLPTKAVVANLLSEISAQKPKGPISNQISKPKIITELDESTKKNPLKLMGQQKMTTIVETTTTTMSTTTTNAAQQQMVSVHPMKALPIIKQTDKILMPIQAEFDWYNLDVEYGKLLPTNILENGKESETQDHVEYNLDAEFSLTSCSDNNSSLESSGSTIHFVPITVAEDCNGCGGNQISDDDIASTKNNILLNPARLKKLINKTATVQTDVNVKSFDTFLEQTGLTEKPLPQKRKIFYNAPFV
ncbi:uncharacterized protein LOC129568022 isoform X2 [Sitodiplosis mosellana]|uniref:uncharacterized protein LOC129568022 isoform X2 n=1 Tax=Sitodiplosis mosellana TaxID=263140 RepID=UPI00244456BF|nr:uncharacterized protein LOC129568022 isoform X2 [Sitodiplosis mosellana]